MKRKQMISFVLAGTLSASSLSMYAQPVITELPQIEMQNDVQTTTSPAIEVVPDDTVTEDKPTVLPLFPEDYEEIANKPVNLPMTPEDYEEIASKPVILPMTPEDYAKMEAQKGTFVVNEEGYTVVQYNEGTLQETIEKLSIEFPEKLKLKGSQLLTKEDFAYLNQNAIHLDLRDISCVNNEIPKEAFSNNNKLTTIKFPNSLEYIQSRAFEYCSKLTGDLIFPDNIFVIGEKAFYSCKALNGRLIFPYIDTERDSFNQLQIKEYAFAYCSNLTGDLILPVSISIGTYAFQGLNNMNGDLIISSDIYFNKPVFSSTHNFSRVINLNKFSNHYAEKNAIVEGCIYYGFAENEAFKKSVEENNGIWKEITYPYEENHWEEISVIYDNRYSSLQEAIEDQVPKELDVEDRYYKEWFNKTLIVKTQNGKQLRPKDFYYMNKIPLLMSIDLMAADIENNTIPDRAFYQNSNLLSVKFQNEKITKYGDEAFFLCENLKQDLNLSDKVEEIGGAAFSGCKSLTGNINLTENLKSLGGAAFSDCINLTGELKIPSTLSVIADSTFNECNNLTGDLIIPDNIIEIGTWAFQNTGFDGKLYLSKNLEKIGIEAFMFCKNLKGDLILPDKIKRIERNTFLWCVGFNGKLVLPKEVTFIDYNAFRCGNLTGDLILPNNLERINQQAFAFNNFDGYLVLPESLNYIESIAFTGNNFKGDLILPEANNLTVQSGVFNNSIFDGKLIFPINEIKSTYKNNFSKNKYSEIINLASINGYNLVGKIDNENPDKDMENINVYGFNSNQDFYNDVINRKGEWHDISSESQWEDLEVVYDNRYNSLQEAIEAQVPLVNPVHYIRDWIQRDVVIITKDNKTLTSQDIDYINQASYLNSLDLSQATFENNKIPNEAFKDNQRLIFIKLPKTLTEIGDRAFENCISLQSITNYCEEPQTIGVDAFKTEVEVPKIAYGYTPNNTFKKAVLDNEYKWQELGIVAKPKVVEIEEGNPVLLESLYEASFEGLLLENETAKQLTSLNLEQLPLGEHEVEIEITYKDYEPKTVKSIVKVLPASKALKANGISKTIMQGQSVQLEELYEVTYKDKSIVPDEAKQTTNFDLTKLPVGKHQIGIELKWKGSTKNVVSEVTVKRKPIIDTSDDNKNNSIPATSLEPSQTIVPMEKLEPASVHKPLIPLRPAFIPLKPAQQNKPIEKPSHVINPSENKPTEPKPIQKPDVEIGKENEVNSNPSKDNESSQVTNKIEQDMQNTNTSKDMIDENSNLETSVQEWIEIEPSLPIQTLEDTQSNIEQIEIPQTPISEEVIMNEDSEQPTNSFYEQVKKLFPNMSYETFILLSSSTAFVVIALILVIVVYINKKRKEKDHE